jgi:hypothetical protein
MDDFNSTTALGLLALMGTPTGLEERMAGYEAEKVRDREARIASLKHNPGKAEKDGLGRRRKAKGKAPTPKAPDKLFAAKVASTNRLDGRDEKYLNAGQRRRKAEAEAKADHVFDLDEKQKVWVHAVNIATQEKKWVTRTLEAGTWTWSKITERLDDGFVPFQVSDRKPTKAQLAP